MPRVHCVWQTFVVKETNAIFWESLPTDGSRALLNCVGGKPWESPPHVTLVEFPVDHGGLDDASEAGRVVWRRKDDVVDITAFVEELNDVLFEDEGEESFSCKLQSVTLKPMKGSIRDIITGGSALQAIEAVRSRLATALGLGLEYTWDTEVAPQPTYLTEVCAAG